MAIVSVLLSARSLSKGYASGSQVLQEVDMALVEGEMVALLGSSGSGKSTLLHCLSTLCPIDTGELSFNGQDLTDLSEAQSAHLRLHSFGFVFQFHHLIPELNVLENILLPATLAAKQNKNRALELLSEVGLESFDSRFPWQLSGGEQQRVALCRALINSPKLLFTDEVTGNLDAERSQEIINLLLKLNKNEGLTILSVTHDLSMSQHYHRQYTLKNAKAVEVEKNVKNASI